MIKTIKILVMVLLVSILQVSLVIAVGPSIRFEHLTVEDGLPQGGAISILQDRQGFLWIGTLDGLVRYDGYDFKVFKHNTDEPHSLSSSYIWTIFEDSQGIIWLGTVGGGLNRFNPKTEQFSHYRYNANNPNSLSSDIVWAISEDQQGTLWLGTGGGLNRFNPKTEQFSHYRFDADNPNSLSNDKVYAITQDHQGTLWLGTDGGGLNRFNPKTEQFSHYRFDADNPNSLSNDKVYAITEDQQGTLWLGTYGGGLNRFNPKTEQFSHYRFDANNPNSLSNDMIYAITEDQQGTLWIGTYSGGLNRFNPKTEQFIHYRSDTNNPSSLSRNWVRAIVEDRQGTLWVGTYGGGLNHFNPKIERFNHYRFDADNPNSLSNDVIWTFIEDQLGVIWIGTDDGLNRFNPKTEQFSHYRFAASNTNNLHNNTIFTIIEDQLGILWLGTPGGLYRFNPKTEQFKHYRVEPNNPNSLNNNTIFSIIEDHQGMLWLGTEGGGLNRFNPKTEQFSHYRFDPKNANSLSNDFVWNIHEDKHGALWIGTNGGLNRFNPKTEQFNHYRFEPHNSKSLSDNIISSIKEDHRGTLWLATNHGLNKMERHSGQFKRFIEKDGLANNVIYRIEEDNNGLLWLSTNQGISRFNLETEDFKNYDMGDGLQSNEFNGGASLKSKNGELFFGGMQGFNRFLPDKITDDSHKPTVVFTDMLLLNKSVPISHKQDKLENKTESSNNRFTLEQAIHFTRALTLTHLENLVSFEFSALDFNNSNKNQYAYRLEGFDNNWIETDYKKRFATYTNLPSGEYVLRVKASNSDGFWNEEGASLKITVLPPPWLSWWAYTIYAVILIGLLLVFVKIQRNKVLFERNLSRQLEHKVTERTQDLQGANTQLELAYRQLEEVSLTDQLTGLKNRRFLQSNIDNDIALINRQYQNVIDGRTSDKQEATDLILFLIDLDHFKKVNDIHGHSAGDAVLIQIKPILEQVFRETDYLVRWGGEEFLVIARFIDRTNGAELAERLRQTVENHDFEINEDKIISKTCSIGFACYPFLQNEPTILTWSQVIDIADHCLYAAKKSNRNAWVGMDSTDSCLIDNIFIRATEQTQSLIESKELKLLSSIPEQNVVW